MKTTKLTRRDDPVSQDIAYLSDIVAQSGTYIHSGEGESILTNIADLDSAIATLGSSGLGNVYTIIGTSDSASIFSGTYTSSAENLVGAINAIDTALGSVASDLDSAESDIDNLQTFIGTDGTTAGSDWVDLAYVASNASVIGAIATLDGALASAASAAVVSLSSAAGTGSILKTYTISQGSSEIGTIDIPLDFLVKSGAVATVTASDKAAGGKFVDNSSFNLGDKYIDFVINAKDGTASDEHMYINTKDLVDVYTAEQNATQIQLAVGSDNVISGEIVDGSVDASALATSAVTTAKIADHAIGTSKIALVDTADNTTSYTLTVTNGRLSLTQIVA